MIPTDLPALIGGKYRPLGVIGEGAMGIVYSVEHTLTGEQLALKVMTAHQGATRESLMSEVEEIMRIRHGLKLDDENDFDLVTQDAVLQAWDQISGATFLGLVVISSIALMVGGIGVMAIMMISVTERTREIGVRKALGARRREILFQFLSEAVVLTSVGGILGILIGSAIGISVRGPCRSAFIAASSKAVSRREASKGRRSAFTPVTLPCVSIAITGRVFCGSQFCQRCSASSESMSTRKRSAADPSAASSKPIARPE